MTEEKGGIDLFCGEEALLEGPNVPKRQGTL